MRKSLASLVVLAALASCAQTNPGIPPKADRFYYPTGIAFVPNVNGGPGFLYVVSSNFDLRFNRGTLAAVDLSTVDVPATASANPAHTDDAHIASMVLIDSFGGPLGIYQRANSGPNTRRLFVAGRQFNTLDVIDVDGQTTRCAQGDPTDCSTSALTLGDSLSDTYRPFVYQGGVYVSHITPLDNPRGSGNNRVSSLARVDAETLGPATIRPVGIEPVDSMAGSGNLLFLGGRAVANANDQPLRAFNVAPFDANSQVLGVNLAPTLDIRDVRGMALSSDGTRLFMITRAPDAIAILDVTTDPSGLPRSQVIGVVELPRGASELAVLPRGPGRRDVVAVTCQQDNVIALYDDEIGRVVSEVRGVGDQPFGVTYGPRPAPADGGAAEGARLYSTSFGRGDVAITDIPNLDNLSSASVLLTFGPNENCLNDNADARPPECQK